MFVKSENISEQNGQPLGAQFDVKVTENSTLNVTIKPVALGPAGTWVRIPLVWQRLPYLGNGRTYNEDHFDLLQNIFTNENSLINLNTYEDEKIWELLQIAKKAGLYFIKDSQPDKIFISKEPAILSINFTSSNQKSIKLTSELHLNNKKLSLKFQDISFSGNPAHGVMIQENSKIYLAKTNNYLDSNAQEIFAENIDSKKYLNIDFNQYLKLQESLNLVSEDKSFNFPKQPEIILVLSVEYVTSHSIKSSWYWEYKIIADTNAVTINKLPLYFKKQEKFYRHKSTEDAIYKKFIKNLNDIKDFPNKQNIISSLQNEKFTLENMQAIHFTEKILPHIKNTPKCKVNIKGKIPKYNKTDKTPEITISTTSNGQRRDWFGLEISVKLEEEEVPFNLIFKTLLSGGKHIILPSGTYFSLEHEKFEALNKLIQKAKSLQENPREKLQISRFSLDLWQELQDLGVIASQAESWEETVQALENINFIENFPLPENFKATLRKYQQEGFDWLMFLYTHNLGGVLADDMGLGKTIQILAFILKIKQINTKKQTTPFLIIAPTSVVGNWKLEAKKFTPDLKVLVISNTLAKQNIILDDIIHKYDIIITSYTLLRMDEYKYYEHPWSGLILDEAQAAKNYKSKVYQCVKRLDIPIKFMITGTPMENNLLELWSMFSLVAPGLFPNPKSFSQYYQRPIERDNDKERLKELKQKINPLILRRTKEEVVLDLPQKQEQIIEIVLDESHKKAYETQLQRERQKVLGMVENMQSNRFAIFQSLTTLRQLSLDPILIDETYKGTSTKLEILFELLSDIVAEKHRVLIFSQFTKFLSRVKKRLKENNIKYAYLDGKTTNREEVIARFKEGTDPVFLISLKAGGVGLNLTEADYCIILDPWWNPAAEAQAVDRAHRIGQTKKVMVYRLVAKDTVEEKVMALKESKAALFSGVMGSKENEDIKFGNKITAEDIKNLLN